MRNAISDDPEETPILTKQIFIYCVSLAGLMLAGCTQHDASKQTAGLKPPAMVRPYQNVPVRQELIDAEPAILGLAEEQDLENLKRLRCQTNNHCK